MNIEQLRSTIASTHSRMFVVRYISKKSNKRKVSNTNPNIVRVYDCESKSYKSFKLESVTEFKCGQVILK